MYTLLSVISDYGKGLIHLIAERISGKGFGIRVNYVILHLEFINKIKKTLRFRKKHSQILVKFLTCSGFFLLNMRWRDLKVLLIVPLRLLSFSYCFTRLQNKSKKKQKRNENCLIINYIP